MSAVKSSAKSSGTLSTFRFAVKLLELCGTGETLTIAIGLLLVFVQSLVTLLQPWPLKLVIDSVFGGTPPPQILAWLSNFFAQSFSSTHSPRISLLAVLCIGAVAIQLLIGAITVLSTAVLVSSGLRMVFRLRCALFDHIQRLSLRFHDKNPVGDSLYRITWDTYSVQAIFNSGAIPAFTALVTLIGISAIMFAKDWLLTLVALAVGVPIMFLIQWMDRPMSAHSTRLQERESDISSRVHEILSGIRVVQAFRREAFESVRFRTHADESLKANLKLTVMQAFSAASVSLVLAAGTGLVIWIAGLRVVEGRLTSGDVILMVAYIAMLYKPLETLAYTAAIVQAAVARGRRVFAILEYATDLPETNTEAPRERPRGQITFDNVSFSYDASRPILKNVCLDIRPGATIALVGASGAGKTTLTALLPRFYDPDAGRVLLDGRDLRSLPLEWLRQNVTIVLQDPVLFSANIRENIAYGRPDASQDDIVAAAEAASVTDFVRDLPDAMETHIGEQGIALSGGQRQRISIARAFLKDAPILIMDEPTSALDTHTEVQLLDALTRLKHGRTTIIVAHRLSTIRDADLVVFMADGRVMELGTHEDLMTRQGEYAKLYAAQFGSRVAAVASLH